MAPEAAKQQTGLRLHSRRLQGRGWMHTSTDRILTTHAGSIPRGEPLGQMLIDEEDDPNHPC